MSRLSSRRSTSRTTASYACNRIDEDVFRGVFDLGDVIQTLLQALDARARALGSFRHAPGSSSVLKKDKDQYGSGSGGNRQGAMSSAMFMLNNISYVRRELLLNSNVPDLMTSAGGNGSRRDSSSTTVTATNSTTPRDFDIEDELNRRNRQAKTSYLEVFSPLVSCLMDAGVEQSVLKSAIGVGNTEKKDTKDRFVRFNESLEEIENLHHRLPNCKIDKNEDLLLRDRLRDEVVRMCVPTYTAFVKRHENFSKSECGASAIFVVFACSVLLAYIVVAARYESRLSGKRSR